MTNNNIPTCILKNKASDTIILKRNIAEELKNHSSISKNFKDVQSFPLVEGKQCLYIMDWQQSLLTFSRGIHEMLGYNKAEFTMDLALNNIHPEDSRIVNRIHRAAFDHALKSNLLAEQQYLRVSHRILKKDGTYIKVMRQSSPYETDLDGKFISNLSFLTDITFLNSNNNKVEWDVFSDNMDVSKFKENIYKEFTNFFTSRELQIVLLIRDSFTNKQIASQLFISSHTVVAHRKNILKKSHCKNAKDLLEFCDLNGIF